MSLASPRPRSLTNTTTSSQPHGRQATHFRPVRYQTKEELDRFFGTTSQQKREQRLRVRESDGQVYFDWIEKDEWQHLLASGSTLTSPSAGMGGEAMYRRRSSAGTALTLNSPLIPGSPARRGSLAEGQGNEGMSPLAGYFDDVQIVEGGEAERRGRKRSSSILAGRKRGVETIDDEMPLSAGGTRDWVSAPGFKRRQSDGFASTSPLAQVYQRSESEENVDRIRISRLPLARRKMNQESLDAAFAVNNPLLDLSPNATFLAGSTTKQHNKPSALHLAPTSSVAMQRSTMLELDAGESNYNSEAPRSPVTVCSGGADNTVDSTVGGRRGTFGSLFGQAAAQAAPIMRMRRASDVGTPPPSSAAMMEFLASPTATTSSQNSTSRTLRLAISFDTPPQAAFTTDASTTAAAEHSVSSGGWGQRQRWHSERNQSQPEPKLRSIRSVASLREDPFEELSRPVSRSVTVTSQRRRKMSNSSEGSSNSSSCEPCFTPLAPRTGAKKFDRTRQHHLDLLSVAGLPSPTPSANTISLPPMRDPLSSLSNATSAVPPQVPAKTVVEAQEIKEPKSTKKVLATGGLRTGPEVYYGVDIPCASIHLHSDPEDNLEPALALSLSKGTIKKLKKKAHTSNAAGGGDEGHARCGSVSSSNAASGEHAKGSSRWWNNILS